MGIDIDSFLEKYHKEENNNSSKEKLKEAEKINFEFQKDTEDKLLKAQKKIKENASFEILEKIYEEVKQFDEDIPSKFIGIENKSNLALKLIGDKYSEEFLLKIKQNVKAIHNEIENHIKILDSKINSDDFSFIIKEFETILKLFEVYPKEFLYEKLKLSEEIRKREIIINDKIKRYKIIKLKDTKIQINNAILSLDKSLVPNNIEEIEGKIAVLQRILRAIPKIFLTDLTEEKIIISKILIKSEKYLEEQYMQEFRKKEENLNQLYEHFHASYINKDLSKTLIIYDEILLEFESMPEVFFERKIKIYQKTNEFYAMINDLFMKNNLAILMQSYNASQIIKEAKDYIRHVKSTSKINLELLENVKIKVSKLPEKSEPEKSNLLKEINMITQKYLKNKNGAILQENLEVTEEKNKVEFEDINNISLDIKSTSKFSKDVIIEINKHFEKIKKSNNIEELKISYKKIMFYLETMQIESKTKKDIVLKVKKILSTKKLA